MNHFETLRGSRSSAEDSGSLHFACSSVPEEQSCGRDDRVLGFGVKKARESQIPTLSLQRVESQGRGTRSVRSRAAASISGRGHCGAWLPASVFPFVANGLRLESLVRGLLCRFHWSGLSSLRKRAKRAGRRQPAMETIVQDLKSGVRQFRKNPGFT